MWKEDEVIINRSFQFNAGSPGEIQLVIVDVVNISIFNYEFSFGLSYAGIIRQGELGTSQRFSQLIYQI